MSVLVEWVGVQRCAHNFITTKHSTGPGNCGQYSVPSRSWTDPARTCKMVCCYVLLWNFALWLSRWRLLAGLRRTQNDQPVRFWNQQLTFMMTDVTTACVAHSSFFSYKDQDITDKVCHLDANSRLQTYEYPVALQLLSVTFCPLGDGVSTTLFICTYMK